MSVWILGPAAGSVVALVVLTAGLRRIAAEAAELRRSLRRTGATAVAADELERLATAVGDHGRATRRSAHHAMPLRLRARRRPTPHR